MAHECPECGQACYCDMEDAWWSEPPDDCDHDCEEEEDIYDADYI